MQDSLLKIKPKTARMTDFPQPLGPVTHVSVWPLLISCITSVSIDYFFREYKILGAPNKLLMENPLASALRIHSFSAHYAVL